LAHVPAPQGARYGQPSGRGYDVPPQHPASSAASYGDGWNAPTHTVSSAYGPEPGAAEPTRGLPAWAALLILIAISAIGGAIDVASGSQVKGGFNIGIVVASLVAIIVVRRQSMFPIVVAPPLIYFGASAVMLYARSGGLHDRKVLLDAAANWLVYGFPAIAGASAAVLIIAGIRMFAGR
jgi:hypothetical protein